jgi:hypothetical protein
MDGAMTRLIARLGSFLRRIEQVVSPVEDGNLPPFDAVSIPPSTSVGVLDEAGWESSDDPVEMLSLLHHGSNARKLRLFAVACCHQFGQFLMLTESRRAVEVAERFADGGARPEALRAAWAAARGVFPAFYSTKMYNFVPALAAVHCARADAWSAALETSARLLEAALPLAVRETSGQVVDGTTAVRRRQAELLRDIFGNPFRIPAVEPAWRTSYILDLSRTVYERRRWEDLHVLADALERSGCKGEGILSHCRQPGPHVRGCWVVDWLIGKA